MYTCKFYKTVKPGGQAPNLALQLFFSHSVFKDEKVQIKAFIRGNCPFHIFTAPTDLRIFCCLHLDSIVILKIGLNARERQKNFKSRMRVLKPPPNALNFTYCYVANMAFTQLVKKCSQQLSTRRVCCFLERQYKRFAPFTIFVSQEVDRSNAPTKYKTYQKEQTV